MLGGMEIIVDVARSPQGQLTGTVRPAGSVKRRDFHGVMELLACLERIIDVDASVLADPTTTKGEQTMTDPSSSRRCPKPTRTPSPQPSSPSRPASKLVTSTSWPASTAPTPTGSTPSARSRKEATRSSVTSRAFSPTRTSTPAPSKPPPRWPSGSSPPRWYWSPPTFESPARNSSAAVRSPNGITAPCESCTASPTAPGPSSPKCTTTPIAKSTYTRST